MKLHALPDLELAPIGGRGIAEAGPETAAEMGVRLETADLGGVRDGVGAVEEVIARGL
jgi:hypothetical protein